MFQLQVNNLENITYACQPSGLQTSQNQSDSKLTLISCEMSNYCYRSTDLENNSRSELLCEVWECSAGHLTCGECFDKRNIGTDVGTRDDTASLDSLKRSSSSVTSIETIVSLRESLAEIAGGENKAWDQYRVNEIDFFLDTLEVRKDAIDFYKDYNNAFKSIFYNPDIEGLSLDGSAGQGALEDNTYRDEKTDRVKTYIQRLRDQGSISSLREALVDVIETDDEEIDPSWATFRLEEIDFFLNTLNIRKDAICYYGDYHNEFKSIFQQFGEEDSEESKTEEGSGNTSPTDFTEEEKTSKKISRCRVCNQFILYRNRAVENLAELFYHG